MKTSRYLIIFGLCFFTLFLIVESFQKDLHAASSDYPSRSITMVVPYAAGGVSDLGTRALADAMEKHLKHPVVVVNKPGGGTTIGGNAVATAKPDGYTLGAFPVSASLPEVFSYFYEAPHSSKDLKPISRVLAPVLTITVKGDAPWNSLKDLIEYAKKNPGMKVATHGKSTLGYLVIRTVGKAEGVSFVDVPFAGGAKIIPAILGGHVPVGTPDYSGIKSLLEAKKLKTLALCIEKKADFAPEIPTVVDLGYKLAFVSYLGIFGPKGMPEEIVKQIDELVHKISEEPDFQKKINSMGMQLNYEDTASFEKSLVRYRGNLQTFFKEEGLVK